MINIKVSLLVEVQRLVAHKILTASQCAGTKSPMISMVHNGTLAIQRSDIHVLSLLTYMWGIREYCFPELNKEADIDELSINWRNFRSLC